MKQEGIGIAVAFRSANNPWRLARHGIQLCPVDLMSRYRIAQVLRGCAQVVNSTRGSDEALVGGVKNLLAKAVKQRVRYLGNLSRARHPRLQTGRRSDPR